MRKLFVALVLISFVAYAKSAVEPAVAKMSVEPIFAGDVLPVYTHPLETNLIQVFHEEMPLAKATVKPKATWKEKSQQIYSFLHEQNEKVRVALEKTSSTSGASEKVIQTTFDQLANNRVSKVEAVRKYDQRGDVGFCFGRAAMVHYLLLQNGIPQSQIAKIFAVGKLRYDNLLWDFHMATMVRGPQGKWRVIDSLFDKPLVYDEWMKRVSEFGTNTQYPQVRFYVTDPRKFQPAYAQYRVEDFNIPELKPYFQALFRSLKP